MLNENGRRTYSSSLLDIEIDRGKATNMLYEGNAIVFNKMLEGI